MHLLMNTPWRVKALVCYSDGPCIGTMEGLWKRIRSLSIAHELAAAASSNQWRVIIVNLISKGKLERPSGGSLCQEDR